MESGITEHHHEKVAMARNEKSGPEDPQPSHLPRNPLRISIKKEVLDSGYDEEEQQASGCLAGCELSDGVPNQVRACAACFDPAVLAGLKVELDVAEESATEDGDCAGWKEESWIAGDRADMLCVKNPSTPDTSKKAEMVETPTVPFRTDLYRNAILTACTRDGDIATLTGQPQAHGWTADSMQYEAASVSQLVLQGWGSDQEPWCVIKTEPLSGSDSDIDVEAATSYIAENGAKAVFNHDKGGRANLEVFIGTQNGEKRYYCPEAGCGKSYKRGEHLKIHARTHTGDRPYLCPEPSCNKSFAHPFGLKEHVKVHTGDKPFQCLELNCGRRFRDRSNFRKHQLMHSGMKSVRQRRPLKKPEKKPYLCPEPDCDRAFSRPSVLQEHLKRHVGDKTFRCSDSECGKAFYKKAALIMHERVHTGERPFCCVEPGCGKSFSRPCHLKDHKVIHSGKKPFHCAKPGCGRAFTQKIQLSYHMRTHTGEKPYRCPEVGCNKAYTQNKHLRYHMRSHTGIQPFPCPEPGCEQSFDRLSLLAKHCSKSHHRKTVNVTDPCRDQSAENVEQKEES